MPGRTLEEQAEAIAAMLPQIMRRTHLIDTEDPTSDLSLAQIRVCTVLRDGPRPVSSLSRELGITCSAITQMADRLEKAGLVERISEEEDRRIKCLKLTPYGDKIMQSRRERRTRRIREVLEYMEPGDREGLINSLEKLLGAVRANV